MKKVAQKQPPKSPAKQPVKDPSSGSVYLNADENVAEFVESLYNEYKIRNNLERAWEYIEDKLKKRVNKVLAYTDFAKKLLKERSFKHATQLLGEAIRKNNDNATLLMEMGKVKYIMQLYPEAAESFAAALRFKDVNRLETCYNLALSCLQMGKNEECLTHLQEVFKIDPDYVEAVITSGIVYAKIGKKDDALKAFNHALELSPDDYDIMNNIGNVLFERGQYEGASEQYLKALQIKPDDIEVLSNLGNSLTKLKDYQNAWLAFEEALKVNPASIPVIENYLLCLLEGKQFDKFEELLGKSKFLPNEIKEKVTALADEYRFTLGIKPRKGLKRQSTKRAEITPNKRASVLGGSMQRSSSGDLNRGDWSTKRRSTMARASNLAAVEEEKNEHDPEMLFERAKK